MEIKVVDVKQLLEEHFEHIEKIWDEDPYNEVHVFALTIKEFMLARGIDRVEEGIKQFIAFKNEQTEELTRLGLHFEERMLENPTSYR